VDIKATIGQLTDERDKLDKAIRALQALEDSPQPAARATARRTTRARRTRRTATSNGASAPAKVLTPAKVVGLVTTDGVPAAAALTPCCGSSSSLSPTEPSSAAVRVAQPNGISPALRSREPDSA